MIIDDKYFINEKDVEYAYYFFNTSWYIYIQFKNGNSLNCMLSRKNNTEEKAKSYIKEIQDGINC